MARLAHDREQAVGADEAQQQVVLDLVRDLVFVGAVTIRDENLPVVVRHHLIRDATAIGRQRRRVEALERALHRDLRAGCRPDHQAVLGAGARDVGQGFTVRRQ